MPEPLYTERLCLEPWSEHTATDLLGKLSATPVVVRYIADGVVWSEAKVHEVSARNAAHWREHGFGWRVAHLADSGRQVGFIGLNFAGEGVHVDPGEYEIGWWLDPGVWGRGLAREGAAALRDEAFGRLGAPSIIARIQPPNVASLAVARSVGLEHDFDTVGRTGEQAAIMRLAAERWRELISSARRGSPPPVRPAGPA